MLFGLLGYVLRRFDYPIAPVVVGLILGPMAEKQLRQALQISQGDVLALFHSWIAIVLWLLALTAVLLPLYLRSRGKGTVLEQIAGDRTDRRASDARRSVELGCRNGSSASSDGCREIAWGRCRGRAGCAPWADGRASTAEAAAMASPMIERISVMRMRGVDMVTLLSGAFAAPQQR